MSDLTLKEAVTRVQNLGGLFKAVMVISDEIDKIGKIEQLASEANAKLAEAQAGGNAWLERHEVIVEAAHKKLAAAEQSLVMAQKDADAARNEARAIIGSAKENAAKVAAVAKDKAAALIADADAKAKASADAIAANAQAIADGDAAIAAKLKELADIESRIEAAREAVKKMMGG